MELIVFVQQNWEAIAIVLGAFGALWAKVREKAWQEFLWLCLDLVRDVAVQQLEATGPEKRAAVVEAAYAQAPLWVKKLVTEDQAEQLAEQAYQLLRGELKQLKLPLELPEAGK